MQYSLTYKLNLITLMSIITVKIYLENNLYSQIKKETVTSSSERHLATYLKKIFIL